MKTVLITGGAGFLGLHTAHGLYKRGYNIILYDIAENVDLREYPPCKYIRGDVRDKKTLEKAMNGVDLVVHGAAALPLWSKEDVYSTNVDGTKNVLEIALEKGVERVVFISSTAVYDLSKPAPYKENDPLLGVAHYGKSKVKAEKICESFRDKLIVPVLRPKTFIGPERLGIFSLLFEWVKEGRKIPIVGSGKNKYQLLDVEDLVDAIALTLELPEKKVNDTFNVGAEKFGTLREDIQALCDYAGTGSRVWPIPKWIAIPTLKLLEKLRLAPMYEWVYATASKDSWVSIDKIKKKLGWRPKYSNVDSLIRTYNWFLENYEKIKNRRGKTHRVIWSEGILDIIKRFL